MEKIKEDILKCIEEANKELERRKRGLEGDGTEKQLEEIIIPELKELLELLEAGITPSKENRFLVSFANAFTFWGWDIRNPSELFILLEKINNAYKNIDNM